MTLQQSIDHLTALARDHNAALTTSLSLERAGVRLSVFWDDDKLPREAHLHFGPGLAWDDSTQSEPDSLEWIWIIDPARFMAAMDEGLDDDKAAEEARRIVVGMDEVDNYLLGKPYRCARRGAEVDA